MEIYDKKFMADVLFVKYLKTFKILNRLHKQNQEILRVQTPILQPSSQKQSCITDHILHIFTGFERTTIPSKQPYPQTMFTFREMLTSLAPFFTAAVVIVLSPFVKEHIPSVVSNYLVSMYEKWLSRFSMPQVTVITEEKGNLKISNQIYEAARAHLRTLVSNSTKPKRFKVKKEDGQNESTIDIVENEEVIDKFIGIRLKWKLYAVREEGYHDIC